MTAALDRLAPAAHAAGRPRGSGRVDRVVGMSIEVAGVPAAVGDGILLLPDGGPVAAEVVALRDGRAVCVPLGETTGLRAGTQATPVGRPLTVRVGEDLLGRVVDGMGQPLDAGPPLRGTEVTVNGTPPHPLRRGQVDEQLPLGVRVLDALTPCGKGQRLGIFAGSGVGKSSLLSMIARGTEASVSVVALIGERGREVSEFIERDLGPEGLARSVVVVATSDAPAMVRIRAAFTATRIAEWFRDRGEDVVLMMDSVTRFAMAQREVGLAAGEPPATRGYPPSVFGLLPRLLERGGRGETGSITGLYTVLVEGDDTNEPIADTTRSILDGHVWLSRALAESGHFPAVDVLESLSRVAPAVAAPDVLAAGSRVRELLAAWRDARDLIEIDAYVPGTNPVVDRAVAAKPAIDTFLRQGSAEESDLAGATAGLLALVAEEGEGMKAYRFRLEAVARVRAVEERAAAQQLALASRRLVEARECEAGAVGELDRLGGPRGRTAAGEVRWAYDQADRAGARVRAERRRVAVVDTEREAARRAWTTARQRCTVLERLDERHRARWEVERSRREAGELDEVATVRFRSREAGG